MSQRAWIVERGGMLWDLLTDNDWYCSPSSWLLLVLTVDCPDIPDLDHLYSPGLLPTQHCRTQKYHLPPGPSPSPDSVVNTHHSPLPHHHHASGEAELCYISPGHSQAVSLWTRDRSWYWPARLSHLSRKTYSWWYYAVLNSICTSYTHPLTSVQETANTSSRWNHKLYIFFFLKSQTWHNKMVLLCFDISPDCWRIITINTIEDWSDRICSNWMYFCQYHSTTYKVLYFVHWILVRKFSAGPRRVTGSRSVWLTGPRAAGWWMRIFCWRFFTH